MHCLQGANPVYHRGKGPLGRTLAFVFFSFLRCDGKPNEPHRKTQRSFDDRKNNEKYMGQTARFFHQKLMVRGGSNV